MAKLLAILLIATCYFSSFAQEAQLLKRADFNERSINEEWVYVKYKTKQQTNSNLSGRSVSTPENSLANLTKIRVPHGKDPIAFCNELRKSGELLYADPILSYQLLGNPSDPLINNQYYLAKIKAQEAWEITQGDDDITIGIIDTGLDLDHEDLINNLWINTDDPIDGIDNDNNGFIDDRYGYDFADLDSDPNIQSGNHGMIIGGIAGAVTNNARGIAGAGYNTKVAALKGFKTAGGVSHGLYDAIIYAADNGFDVVNLSWGRMNNPLQSEQDIINYAVNERNMVVVAAAGNEGKKPTRENKWYPASYDNVLSVGASDASDEKSAGSTYNYAVDLIAPGVAMYSTLNNNEYGDGGPGTSYAAPLVAATAALVKNQFPNLSAVQIMERIRATTDDIYDIASNTSYQGKLGKGRLNMLRAVSETNVKSLRASNVDFQSKGHQGIFYGDTVQVTITFINHLSPINNSQVTISSPEGNFSITQDNFPLEYLSTFSTSEISFEIILDDNLPPNTSIPIRLDYMGSGYTDFQHVEIVTSPDYAYFGNDQFGMTINGNGNLSNLRISSGSEKQLDTLMQHTGLMIATHSDNVSDNIISSYSTSAKDQDFQVQKNYKPYYHPGSDFFSYSEFTDETKPLIIEQSNMAWKDEDILIIRYRIVNNSPSVISNLSVGVFSDWELGDPTQNTATYDAINHYAFTKNNANDQFAGVKVIGGDQEKFSMLDMGNFNGNTADVNDTLSDALKYDLLVNQQNITAGTNGSGNDVAMIQGTTINELAAYNDTFIDVIYAIADSKDNLESTLQTGVEKLHDFISQPRILETFYTCDGSSLNINPEEGINYAFYKDPLAQNLIATGTSFTTGTITKDTAFYVKNIDQDYSSDIYQVQLKLLTEIADFKMSPDTLYLDHPTTNVVQFSDESLDATSWNWNFGEGTQSTLQHPALSFSAVGSYTISLGIESSLGCSDTITKQLIVANRPPAHSLTGVTVCPDEDVIVHDPTAEKINLYTFKDQQSPTTRGTFPKILSVTQDTIIYVSGIYSSLESKRTPFQISVRAVEGDFQYMPDTTSQDHHLLFTAINTTPKATIQWLINGQSFGGESTVSVPISTGSMQAKLLITSAENCTKVVEKTISISTSPYAFQADVFSCNGSEVIIQPQNGKYFAFYEDPALTNLIKKGTYLKTNNLNKVYVTGIDDGLPGNPIEVNVTNRVIEFNILYDRSSIGKKEKIALSVETDTPMNTYEWYIDGVLTETSPSPTFFLDNKTHEIVARGTTNTGCTVLDTLNLALGTPLSISSTKRVHIYPNPSHGLIHVETSNTIDSIAIFSLDGKPLFKPNLTEDTINLTDLTRGMYLLKIKQIDGEISTHTLLLK